MRYIYIYIHYIYIYICNICVYILVIYIWVMYGSCTDYVSYLFVEFLELINALGLTAYHQETPRGGTTITQTNQFLTTALI
jgi:hypothetical protein